VSAPETPLGLVPTLLTVLGCLVASGFCSGCETGLMSTSRIRLRTLLGQRRTRAGATLLRLLDRLEEPVLACLIGTNLFNVLGSAVMTLALTARYGARGEWLTMAVMSVLTILFAEIVPKILYREYPERLTLASAPLLRAVMLAGLPVLLVLRAYTRLWHRLLPDPAGDPAGTLDRRTVTALLLAHTPSGGVDRRFSASLQRFLDLAELDLRRLLKPFSDWTFVSSGMSVRACLETARSSGLSRLPVVDEGELKGYVLVRDLLLLPQGTAPETVLPPALVRTCLLVDAGMSAYELFEELHAQRQQLAVAVDREGRPLGLVTLEDLIETIVGSIQDEFDRGPTGTGPAVPGSTAAPPRAVDIG
jgi:CBS domain containing-hemolysin-like protein